MRPSFASTVMVWLVATAATVAAAQPTVQPLLTSPSEKVVIAKGFRDWIGFALAGNTVIAGAPNAKGGLFALDANTRATKWAFHSPSGQAPRYPSTRSTIVGDVVITGLELHVNAVSLATGKELWVVPAESRRQTHIPVTDGLAFVLRERTTLVALDIATGQERWKVEFPNQGEVSTPEARDGAVYIAAAVKYTPPRNQRAILALDAKTGVEQWRYPVTTDRGGSVPKILIVTDDAVYGGGDWHFFGVNRRTGAPLWQPTELYRMEGGQKTYYDTKQIVDAGSVIVGATLGGLVALDKTRGNVVWEHPMTLHHYEIASAGHVVYFSAEPVAQAKGPYVLRALDVNTRQILWSYERKTNHPPWRFKDITPVDGGLWVSGYGAIMKLQ